MTEPPLKPILQPPPGFRNPQSNSDPIKLPARTFAPPAPYKPKRRSRRSYCSCRCCYCYTCLLLILTIFLVLIASAIFYLWYQPKLPNFNVHSITFPKFNVTVKPDGTYLDCTTAVSVQAINPNSKIKMNYGKSEVVLSVGGDIDLGSSTLPGFIQGSKNMTSLRFTTQVKHMLVADDDAKKLKDGFKSKELMIGVEVKTTFGIGVDGWNMNKVAVDVKCGGVTLKRLQDGASPHCVVNLLKVLNLK